MGVLLAAVATHDAAHAAQDANEADDKAHDDHNKD
jgi:hypothetical protein